MKGMKVIMKIIKTGIAKNCLFTGRGYNSITYDAASL